MGYVIFDVTRGHTLSYEDLIDIQTNGAYGDCCCPPLVYSRMLDAAHDAEKAESFSGNKMTVRRY